MSSAEVEELARLRRCQSRIEATLREVDARLAEYGREISDRKVYMWEARRDMDHIEKIAVRETIAQTGRSAEFLQAQQGKLLKLLRSPYFGRFDFKRDDAPDADPEAIYIGVHHFHDESAGESLVHDWRAPIASLFYDYELGAAHYIAPTGAVEGEISRKRQFRIRDGRLEFLIESNVNVVDDILQEELSRSSDAGMKQIVATIQRDQNAIIRDEEAHTLVIQGVAGSGKTSIALHRIAFLLYRFKDTLSSEDILIVSPNKVFADYIGNVLPELGEEQVEEVSMDGLAAELLDHQYKFQTFFEQTAELLEKRDAELEQRIAAKSQPDFLRQIDIYAEHLERGSFEAVDWKLGRKIVPAWHFDEIWHRHRSVATTERVARVVEATVQQMGIHYNHNLETSERQALREAVRAMVRGRVTLRDAYRGLYDWMGQPELFKASRGRLEYADVFPLIYLKLRMEGIDHPRKRVKHLLIDEMQDYTPLQYAVLAKLFTCRKTVLGDVSQSVHPHSASSAEQIREALMASTFVELTKSYRSTLEIMQFALAIAPNPKLETMERHGEVPEVLVCAKPAEAHKRLLDQIADFEASEHRSLALIAKTPKQAKKLHRDLLKAGVEATLLDVDSASFGSGVVICTVHLAKGLEFDRVIVANASAQNYPGSAPGSPHDHMDRNLLYVACTRAMHRLCMISVGELSPLLPAQS